MRHWVLLILFIPLLAASCSVDLLGFIGSDDFELRQGERNAPHFLDPRFRSLTTGDTYSFLVLSDTHIEGRDAHGLDRLPEILEPGDAFVVITGDITQSGQRGEVERFIEIVRTIEAAGIPCYPVLGNHDTYFGHWPVWKELIGSSTYRIDSETATLFILDSANATFGNSQLRWFEGELGSARGQVFVFTHANLFVEHPGDLVQLTDVRERARFMTLLERRRGAVFMGHVHRRILKTIGGMRYITIEDFRDNQTYCRVKVCPGGLSWEFHRL
jgi:predicted phosphodiesterase